MLSSDTRDLQGLHGMERKSKEGCDGGFMATQFLLAKIQLSPTWLQGELGDVISITCAQEEENNIQHRW